MRKWPSNDFTLLNDIDPSNHGLATKVLESDEHLKILGIAWNPELDVFKIKINNSISSVATKRSILSGASRLFNPLGWITPVVISIKILLQDLWLSHCDWDDHLPDELVSRWRDFQLDLSVLEEIAIPRWTGYDSQNYEIELHGFSDASIKAYAAVIYLRLVSRSGIATLSLIASKSRVAPVQTISVPRLELCAAHLLIDLLAFVKSSLRLSPNKCYCWTDSTIVLYWISQPPCRWKTFVANRVAQIQDGGSTVVWKHISTNDNPADCASRGLKLTPSALRHHRLWWSGPPWLTDNEPTSAWPDGYPTSLRSPILEERRVKCVDRIDLPPS